MTVYYIKTQEATRPSSTFPTLQEFSASPRRNDKWKIGANNLIPGTNMMIPCKIGKVGSSIIFTLFNLNWKNRIHDFAKKWLFFI